MIRPMKAIETEYDGYKFRSRIEARWAVLLNYLEVPWEYEKEGYELGDGVRYLPDFWLPTKDLFLEIKGAEPSEVEIDKALKLHEGTGKTVAMVIDLPKLGRFADTRWYGDIPGCWIVLDAIDTTPHIVFNAMGHLCWACPACGSSDCRIVNSLVVPETHDVMSHLVGTSCPHRWWVTTSTIQAQDCVKSFDAVTEQKIFDLPTILSGGDIRKAEEAIAAARHARFEHGRNGD